MEKIEEYLGLIAASRRGLSENELQELLSFSENASNMAVVDEMLLRVHKSLDNFLVKRAGLITFFHPEFERSIKQNLGRSGLRNYHKKLALYFQQKGLSYERTLFEICYQQQWSEDYEGLLKTLTNLEFLEAKCMAKMADDLLEDFERVASETAVPFPESLKLTYYDTEVGKKTLILLGKALKLDIAFLRRYPEYLFQTFWNRCYWYDSPEAAKYYQSMDQSQILPWDKSGGKIYPLVEIWRKQKEEKKLVWLKSVRPMEMHLNSPLVQILRGHEGWVTSVSISPDGKKIASAAHDKIIFLWDIATGECLQKFEGHEDKLTCVAFHPKGNLLASASEDKTIRIWNVENAKCLAVLQGHEHVVEAVDWDKNGRLASVSKDRTIRIWDVEKKECLSTLKGHEDEVNCVAFSPDGKYLVTGSADKTVRLWKLETGACIRKIDKHARKIYKVVFTPDGKKIISASRDDTTRVWDAETGQRIHTLQDHEWGVLSLAISHDGTKIVTGGGDKTLCLYDLETGQLLKRLFWHERSVADVKFTPNGKFVVSSSYDKTVRIWKTDLDTTSLTLKSHAEWIRCIAFSPNGKIIATGSTDRKIFLWNGLTGEWIAELVGHGGWITTLAFSSDGKKLVTGSGDNTIKVWNLPNLECVSTLQGHKEPVLAILFIDQDRWILSGSRDKTIRIWESQTGTCTKILECHEGWIVDVDFSPEKRQILSASHDGTARIWDWETGQCVKTIPFPLVTQKVQKPYGLAKNPSSDSSGTQSEQTVQENSLRSAAFTANGDKIVLNSKGSICAICDPTTGECKEQFVGELDCHEFHLSQTRFYVLIKDFHTVIVEKETGKEVARFPEIVGLGKISKHGKITGISQGTYLYLLELVTPSVP